jgi:uncharacterized repeat protein (TIGR01451 family)
MSKQIRRRSGRRRRGAAISVALTAGLGGLLGLGTSANAQVVASTSPDVTLCQATHSGSNPYELKTADAAGAVGHLGHQDGNDIIPPFTYGGAQYSQNWTPSADALVKNGCFALTVTKTGDATVQPGGFITYTIVVGNLGGLPIPIPDVTVHDDTAKATPPVQPPDAIAPGGTATWTAVSTDPVPSGSGSCGGTITNTATVSFTPGKSLVTMSTLTSQDKPGPSASDTWSTTVVCPSVSIAKTATNGPVAPGGNATYDITITNTGAVDIPLADITVTDANATPVAPLTPTTLTPGSSAVWTATMPVPAETPCDIGTVSNTASVSLAPAVTPTSSLPQPPVVVDPSATATTPVVCPVDLTVAKATTSITAAPGTTVPYTITVTNPSGFAVPFSAISVTDDGATITPPADVSPLAPGTSREWTATKVAPADITACNTTMNNTAQVAVVLANLPPGYSVITPGGASSAVVGVPITGGICDALLGPAAVPAGFVSAGAPNLVVRKSGPATARRGGAITYRLRVTNTGNLAARNVVLTDTPPTTMVIGATPSGATRTGRTLTWNLGTVPAGASRTVSVTMAMRLTARGTPCNIARATASNASSVRGKACTRIVAVRDPAVTG